MKWEVVDPSRGRTEKDQGYKVAEKNASPLGRKSQRTLLIQGSVTNPIIG